MSCARSSTYISYDSIHIYLVNSIPNHATLYMCESSLQMNGIYINISREPSSESHLHANCIYIIIVLLSRLNLGMEKSNKWLFYLMIYRFHSYNVRPSSRQNICETNKMFQPRAMFQNYMQCIPQSLISAVPWS